MAERGSAAWVTSGAVAIGAGWYITQQAKPGGVQTDGPDGPFSWVHPGRHTNNNDLKDEWERENDQSWPKDPETGKSAQAAFTSIAKTMHGTMPRKQHIGSSGMPQRTRRPAVHLRMFLELKVFYFNKLWHFLAKKSRIPANPLLHCSNYLVIHLISIDGAHTLPLRQPTRQLQAIGWKVQEQVEQPPIIRRHV